MDDRVLIPFFGNPAAPWRTRLLFEHSRGDNTFDAIKKNSNEVFFRYAQTGES